MYPSQYNKFPIQRRYLVLQGEVLHLASGLFKGVFIAQKDMPGQYVQDLQRGAEQSPYLPDELKRFFDFFLHSLLPIPHKPLPISLPIPQPAITDILTVCILKNCITIII